MTTSYNDWVRRLKALREKVNWENERERLDLLNKIHTWATIRGGQLPNLRDILQKEEIDRLLTDRLKHWCVKSIGEERFMEFVIRSGYKDEPDVDDDGKPLLRRTTPLHHAYYNGIENWQIVRKFFTIYDKFNANYIDDRGLTHFQVALMYGCVDAVKKFLELGQDPNCLDPESGTPLLYFAMSRPIHREMSRPICYEAMSRPIYSEMILPCQASIILMLKGGADPNVSNHDGSTPLHFMSGRCVDHCYNFSFAEEFLKTCDDMNRPANLEARDNLGRTPLHVTLAEAELRHHMTRLLLRRGADPDAADYTGSTALHTICWNRYNSSRANFNDWPAVEFFKIIDEIQRPLRIDARDYLGRTALQLAVANQMPLAVDLLLDHGADLSSFVFPADRDLDAVLHCADYTDKYHFKLWQASGLLACVERLESSGYELKPSDALAIMRFFAKRHFFPTPEDLGERLLADDKKTAIGVMVIPGLSLYDLMLMRPEEAKGRVTHLNCYTFSQRVWYSILEHRTRPCLVRVCEKMSRGFFRRSALEPFMVLTHYRLSILCCEMILAPLSNQDLYHICLAATAQHRELARSLAGKRVDLVF